MLRWTALIIIVIGLTALATFWAQGGSDAEISPLYAVNESKGPQPKVVIGEALIFDFGTMSQESSGKHSWEIKNVGIAPLKIWLDGKTTCSCTVATLQETGEDGKLKKKIVEVKPGSSTKIDLDWQTKNFQNEYSQGATIGTNDPVRQSFHLTIKGTVYPPVMVFPPEMITLNGISNEETTQTRIAVLSKDRPDTKITKVSTSRPDLIVATVSPLSDDDRRHLGIKQGHRIDININPGMPLGSFQDELIIETDHPLRREVKVTIAGKTTGPITIVPERLRMASVSASNGASQSMTLVVRGGRPTRFEVIQKPANVDVEITQSEAESKKGRYRLTVTVPPGTPAGLIDDPIVLRTDHPRAKELKIPVRILVSNTTAG